MQISVRTNVDEIVARLGTLQTEQIPFAAARALTQTAKEASQSVNKAMTEVFDRPVAFTRNATTIVAANKAALSASVVVKDIQAKYLAIQATGGAVRRRSTVQVDVGGVFFVPATPDILNSYGNIPRGWLVKALANKRRYFVGRAGKNKTLGIWESTDRGLRLLLIAKTEVTYKKRFDFKGHAERVFRARFPTLFELSLKEAIASAR